MVCIGTFVGGDVGGIHASVVVQVERVADDLGPGRVAVRWDTRYRAREDQSWYTGAVRSPTLRAAP